MKFDTLSHKVIGCAIEVHRTLGPGLLESAYEQCLAHELDIKQIPYECQVAQPVAYKGLNLECGYRLDMVIDNQLILELKSVSELNGIHQAQLLTYMKLSGIKNGLLINFNVEVLKNGLRRLELRF